MATSELGSRLTQMDECAGEIGAMITECRRIPDEQKETRHLVETLRDSTKHISSMDPSTSERSQRLLTTFDAGEGRSFDFTTLIIDCAHTINDIVNALQNLANACERKFNLSGSGKDQSLKYCPKSIQSELDFMKKVYGKLAKHDAALQTFRDNSPNQKVLATLQEVMNELQDSSYLEEAQMALEETHKYQDEHDKEAKRRSEKMTEAKEHSANTEFLKQEVKQVEKQIQTTQSQLTRKLGKLKEVEDLQDQMQNDFAYRSAGRSEEAKRKAAELEELETEDEKKSRAPLVNCRDALEKVHNELLSFDSFNTNHIIMVFDNSVSMKGRRWRLALQAGEAFRAALVHQGSQDKVSVVSFNSRAKRLCNCVPVTQQFIELLKAEEPVGGTSFARAWEKIEECIESGPPFSRIFVIFLTDCESQDILESAGKAEAIAASNQKPAMTSFFVQITESLQEAETKKHQMMPLVMAANGGRAELHFADEKIPLLEVVKAEDLVPTFRKIANMVSTEKSVLEARLHKLNMQKKELLSQCAEDRQENRVYYQELRDHMRELAHRGQAGACLDKDMLKDSYEQRRKDLQKDVDSLEETLAERRKEQLQLQKLLAASEEEQGRIEMSLQQSQRSYVETSKNLSTIAANNAEEVGRIQARKLTHVQKFGTSNSKAVKDQLNKLNGFKESMLQGSIMEQEFHKFIGAVRMWTELFLEQLENPLQSIEVCWRKVALKRLLNERRLDYKGIEEEDMETFVGYEARKLDNPQQVYGIISDAEVLEKLCQGPKVDGQAADEIVGMVESHAFEQAGCGLASINKQIRDTQKEVANKAAEVQKAKEGKKAHDEESIPRELVEEMQSAAAELQDAQKGLEEELRSLLSERKRLVAEQNQVRNELQPTLRVLKQIIQLFHGACHDFQAEQEKAFLKHALESYKNQLYQPAMLICEMSKRVSSIYNTRQQSRAAPALQAHTRLCLEGP